MTSTTTTTTVVAVVAANAIAQTVRVTTMDGETIDVSGTVVETKAVMMMMIPFSRIQTARRAREPTGPSSTRRDNEKQDGHRTRSDSVPTPVALTLTGSTRQTAMERTVAAETPSSQRGR